MGKIERAIRCRAAGVFQWVVLVIRRVFELRGEGTKVVLAEIGRLPQELEALYEDIFQHLVERNREDAFQALRILRWITFAVRPLSLHELRFAVSTEAEQSLDRMIPRFRSSQWCPDDKNMAGKIWRLSRSLARACKDEGDIETVQFDHESVREFMVNGGIFLLEEALGRRIGTGKVIGQTHFALCQVCMRHLASSDPRSGSKDRASFLDYAIVF